MASGTTAMLVLNSASSCSWRVVLAGVCLAFISGNGDQHHQDAATDLERPDADVQEFQDGFAQQGKGDRDDGHRFGCGQRNALALFCRRVGGQADEDRNGPDRVDQHKKRNELRRKSYYSSK